MGQKRRSHNAKQPRYVTASLTPRNADHQQAARILDEWCEQGYSVSAVLVLGLLALAGHDLPPPNEDRVSRDLRDTLARLDRAISNLQTVGVTIQPDAHAAALPGPSASPLRHLALRVLSEDTGENDDE